MVSGERWPKEARTMSALSVAEDLVVGIADRPRASTAAAKVGSGATTRDASVYEGSASTIGNSMPSPSVMTSLSKSGAFQPSAFTARTLRSDMARLGTSHAPGNSMRRVTPELSSASRSSVPM